jgi:hypothetical protein
MPISGAFLGVNSLAKRCSAIRFSLVLLHGRQDLHIGDHDLARRFPPRTTAADSDARDI